MFPFHKSLKKQNRGNRNSETQPEKLHTHILKRSQLHARKLITTVHAGHYKSLFTSSGLEYDHSRDYVFGDDIRHIDWNVSARMQSTYVKSFEEERERILWVVCDVSSSMEIGAPRSLIGLAAEVVATLFFFSHAHKDKIGGLLFSHAIHEVFKASKTSSIVPQAIASILAERENEGSNLYDALLYTKNVVPRNSLVVIISDFLTDTTEESIGIIADKYDVLLIRLLYDIRAMFPKSGSIYVRDFENNARAMYSFGDIRKSYNKNYTLYNKHWHSLCQVHNVRSLDLLSTESVFSKLASYMKNKNHNTRI